MKTLLRACASVCMSAALAACAPPVLAQKPPGLPGNYPSKPIRVIVPSSPGGGLDIVGRPVAGKLGDRWQTSVIVENRGASAGSGVAIDYMARLSAPDGYTLFVGSASTMIEAGLIIELPYDIEKKITPIAQFNASPFILAGAANLPANNVKELIAYAKANPNELNFASSGTGSSGHLAGELLKFSAGIQMTHVPYKGIGPGLIDMMGGRIQVLFGSTTATMPHVNAGKIKALAVSSLRRAKALPDIPALAETLPGFEVITWWGMLGPDGMPRPIVMALNNEINQILVLPDVQKIVGAEGAEITVGTPEQFRDTISKGLSSVRTMVNKTGIKLH